MTETNIYSHEDKKMRNSAQKPSEMEHFKQPQNELFLIRTNKDEQIKQQRELKKQPVKICTNSQKEGGNVYSEDDEILRNYAIKHGADNENRIRGYVNKLKETKSAEKIIKEYKQKRFIKQRAENEYKRSQEQIRLYKSYKKDAVPPETCAAWVEFRKKIRNYRGSANALSV